MKKSGDIAKYRCSRQIWDNNKDTWQKICPWLEWRNEGVICVACAATGMAGTMAKDGAQSSLKLCNFAKHSELTSHRSAIQMLLGNNQKAHDLEMSKAAPSTEEFRVCWAAVKRGSCHDVDDDTPGNHRDRYRKKVFCLAEAVRTLNRDFLQDCQCISLSQDGTQGRLLTRFLATNSKLDIRRGIMGLQRDIGSGHKAILRATLSSIESMATPNFGAPLTEYASEMDDQLAQRMRDCVK
eukprot:9336363-Pyramimonas_sp.AAC.1